MVTARKLPPNSTLADRIQWILDERGWTAYDLSRACGWNEKQVTAYIARLRKDPAFSDRISLQVYKDLARGGQVSLAWIQLGVGEPRALHVEEFSMSKYPNLERAVMKNNGRWHHSIIERARVSNLPGDLSIQDWEAVLDNFETAVVHEEREVLAALQKPYKQSPPRGDADGS